jgi:hypothetical protein
MPTPVAARGRHLTQYGLLLSCALTVPCAGPALGGALAASPNPYAFGSVAVGAAPVVGSVVITNSGSTTTISSISLGPGCGEFSVIPSEPLPAVVGNGGSLTFQVAYEPDDRRSDLCGVTLTSDGTGGGFDLSGDGIAAELHVTPSLLSFGDQPWDGGVPQTLYVTIMNAGELPIAESNLSITLATGEHFAVGAPTGLPIGAGEMATVPITFDPTSAGPKTDTATLSIDNDPPGDPNETVALSGSGTGTVSVPGGSTGNAGLLLRAAPNPFISTSLLGFTLAEPALVELRIYDSGGRLVRTMARSRLGAGAHGVAWDGRDMRGGPVPAGIYLVRLSAGTAERVTRIVKLERGRPSS